MACCPRVATPGPTQKICPSPCCPRVATPGPTQKFCPSPCCSRVATLVPRHAAKECRRLNRASPSPSPPPWRRSRRGRPPAASPATRECAPTFGNSKVTYMAKYRESLYMAVQGSPSLYLAIYTFPDSRTFSRYSLCSAGPSDAKRSSCLFAYRKSKCTPPPPKIIDNKNAQGEGLAYTIAKIVYTSPFATVAAEQSYMPSPLLGHSCCR